MRLSRIIRFAAALLGAGASLGAVGAVLRATIELPEALGLEFGSPPQRSVKLELFLQGKDVKAVLVVPTARNPALAAWDARDVGSSLKWNGGKLEGVVSAKIFQAGSNDAVPWKCVIDAAWKKGSLTGRANSFSGINSEEGCEFSVIPIKVAGNKGGDGFVELFLPSPDGGAGIHSGIVFRDGKAVGAAAFSPLIHPVWQKVDVSKLLLKSGRISGSIQFMPAESGEPGKEGPAIELKADLRDGLALLPGKTGAGLALLLPVPEWPKRAEIELAFDAPLLGGERWRRRAVVRIEIDDNAVKANEFLNGRMESGWSGIVDGMAFEAGKDQLEGVVEATVASSTVQPGFYRIRFKGEIVGLWLVGTFESELAGGDAATGAFTGWAAPAAR